MDGITNREVALVKSRVVAEIWNSPLLKQVNEEIAQLIEVHRAEKRKIRKVEVSLRPPKVCN